MKPHRHKVQVPPGTRLLNIRGFTTTIPQPETYLLVKLPITVTKQEKSCFDSTNVFPSTIYLDSKNIYVCTKCMRE